MTRYATIAVVGLLLIGRAAAADYPHYRGDGSGSVDSGLELIEDIAQAKPVWNSEEPVPPTGRKPYKGDCGRGGYGIPILAGDRLYMGFWVPSGPEFEFGEGSKTFTGQPFTDEVVICIDRKTGKTLWRTVFPGAGWNYYIIDGAEGQMTPCHHDGKVLMLGVCGRAYCLDAETGRTLWEKPSGTHAEAWELYKEAVLARKDGFPGKNDFGKHLSKYVEQVLAPRPPKNPDHGGSGGGGYNSTPRVFGDVAVFNLMGDETVAFDLETGAERWRRQGINRSTCSVVAWSHGDREYLIGDDGAYDPTTGERVFGFPRKLGGAYQGSTWAISGDYLVGAVPNPSYARNESERKGPYGELKCIEVCYKLGPHGAEEVWRLPYATAYMSPVIHRGHAYLHSEIRDFTPLPEAYPKPDFAKMRGGVTEALICIELATGAVKGVGRNLGGCNEQGSSPFAMDGRIITYCGTAFDTLPGTDGVLKPLGHLPNWQDVRLQAKGKGQESVPPDVVRAMKCCPPTGADGLLYLRPYDDRCLVQCIDLRRDPGKK